MFHENTQIIAPRSGSKVGLGVHGMETFVYFVHISSSNYVSLLKGLETYCYCLGCLSIHPSPQMGIYWVEMNWVLAIYSVTVQKKYPINLRHLLGV